MTRSTSDESDATATTIGVDDVEHAARRRRIIAWLTAAAVPSLAVLLVFVGFGLFQLRQDFTSADVWDPLGDYPQQQADNEVTVTPGVQAFVRVFAVKCADEDVAIVGSLGWRSVDPRGNFVNVPIEDRSGSVRRAGCTQFDFVNGVPDEVVAITAAFGGRMQWQIHGTETPFRGGEVGEPRDFESSPIWVTVVDSS